MAVLLAVNALLLVPARISEGAAQETLPAASIVERIGAGETVQLTDTIVTGDFDLTAVASVPRPFRCTACVFQGAILAANVEFAKGLDLRGSEVQGAVDFNGAIFEATVLFERLDDRRTRLAGPVDFSQAEFRDTSSFVGAVFEAEALFVSAAFHDDASFTEADFEAAASFDGTHFDGQLFFGGNLREGVFGDVASFRRVTFGARADFRQRVFQSAADFEVASFEQADFTLARFQDEVSFRGASFGAQSSFVVAVFEGNASFEEVTASAPLYFDSAEFFWANFELMRSDSLISMKGILVLDHLRLNQFSAAELVMDVDVTSQIETLEFQKSTLSLIEETAKKNRNLGLANDALYQRRLLSSEDLNWFWEACDYVFYRKIGGYLVRPTNPLYAFVALIAVVAAVRIGHRVVTHHRERKASAAVSRDRKERVLAAEVYANHVFQGLFNTVNRAFTVKPGIELGDDQSPRAYLTYWLSWLEFLSYKVLIVVFLLALGNSNPTLREMIGAVI